MKLGAVMPVYSDEQLAQLMEGLETVADRAAIMVERLLSFSFKDPKAEEYAYHGLSRRITSIAHSVQRVFEELPPDMEGLPDLASREEATVHIQSVAFHTYGCFDNLAHIWVAERNIKRDDGRAIPPRLIGFGEKCEDVLASLPASLQSQLAEIRPWMRFLEAFRHSSAHRIPVYIPPFVMDPRRVDEYNTYTDAIGAAIRASRLIEAGAIAEKKAAMRKFRPMVATSIYANTATALFHPQLLADFATVEEWTNSVLQALSSPKT